MNFKVGQAVCGRIRFKDGEMPAYDRTYLVVTVEQDYIEVLNVSSIRGKEHKLLFETNERISQNWPPFKWPSFVKLDSLTRVPAADFTNIHILCGGKQLNSTDLNNILNKLSTSI